MRLLTWNACRGRFLKKTALLESLAADIAVVSEIAKPETTSDRCLWFGHNPNQGLAVICSSNYRLTPIPQIEEPPLYVIPIQVEGPTSFTLFAVWTIKNQKMPYIQAVASAIDRYAGLFEKDPVIMMGDFNANAIWDSLHPPNLNHSSVVQRLIGLGMTSAYHHFNQEEHGRETQATFYLHRNSTKAFHIDYCFLPVAWANQIHSISIGSHGKWLQHSDHMPLVVDMLPRD